MDDLISRQQAIEVVQNRHMMLSKEKVLLINDLEKLPSAQPTFDARDTQYNLPIGTDCISRQQAIDALRTCYDTETITMDNGDEYINYGDAVGEIEQLPPIQPEPSQVARDISRIIENEKDMRIQPKKGRWILDRSGAYCCSECMEPCAGYVMMKPRDKFCKMCGSRNEVTE